MFSCRVNDQIELRLLQASDSDELFALTDVNRVYLRTWLPWVDSTNSPSDTKKFIQSTLQQFADNQGFVSTICYEKSIVGIIGFNQIDWENRIGYIGYWLAEDYQGQGIMTISCRAIINYAFTAVNLNRLVIACASNNRRSRAIPERLGFNHEGTAREAEWVHDHFVDHEIYALIRRDWNN
ncbi:GNAT family N-acetyltransferase [Nodularia spumigena]|uniref:GNAT family N-acetyltransferase n=1 Tax=Nodularia spumigena TaxID=70799 RepID=UPI002B1F61F0|nr:GNAT family protein [Nodularia spumigena]MEA5559317.1 GNAT family protein [Nodularia spumigena CH309]